MVNQAGNHANGTPGPVISPQAEHAQPGQSLTLGLTIPAGQFLTVDLGAEQAMLGGPAPRTGMITQDSPAGSCSARGSARCGSEARQHQPRRQPRECRAWW